MSPSLQGHKVKAKTQNCQTGAAKLTMPLRRSAQSDDSGMPDVSKTLRFTSENDECCKCTKFGSDATSAMHFRQFGAFWDVSDSPLRVPLALLSLPRASKGRILRAHWCLKRPKVEPEHQKRRAGVPKLTMPVDRRLKATILGSPKPPKHYVLLGKTTIFAAC